MKLIPILGPGKNGTREYRTPDGRWRLFRTLNPVLWKVQQRSDTGWLHSASFAKRRDARIFLEDTLEGHETNHMTDTTTPAPLPRCPGIIIGTRLSTREATVTIDGRPLDWRKSLALRNHSPTGVEWGYLGSGPAQLALALLLEVADDATALRFYQRFKDGVISRIATDRWALTTADVTDWLRLSHNRTDIIHMDVETDPDPRS
ncbi:MAG: DUF6166 domain-containing protein [Chromatiales bacterium]|nr:DUF6166 domain-containing protein [Chromatiales bacterium]